MHRSVKTMIGFVGLLLWISGDGLAHETTYARAEAQSRTVSLAMAMLPIRQVLKDIYGTLLAGILLIDETFLLDGSVKPGGFQWAKDIGLCKACAM